VLSKNKTAFTATDTNSNYLFYLPIACAFWKNIGWDFHYMIADQIGGTPVVKFVKSLTDYLGGINAGTLSFCNIESKHLAPFLRIFGSRFVLNDSYILSTDVDMLPLNKEWFDQITENDITILGENPPGYGMTRFPICYIGGTRRTWNDLLGNHSIDKSFEDCVQKFSEREVWSYDELFLHYLINNQSKYKVNFIGRDMIPNPGYHGQPHGVPGILPIGRLDRSYWKPDWQTQWIDAHCMRPGYDAANWPYIKELIYKYIPDEKTRNLLYYYREIFTEMINDKR
jgi:hypothetical protein